MFIEEFLSGLAQLFFKSGFLLEHIRKSNKHSVYLLLWEIPVPVIYFFLFLTVSSAETIFIKETSY